MSDHNGHANGRPSPTMSPEQFAQYLERRLVLNDDEIEIQGRTGTQLRLRVNGRDVVADVMNFYHAYANDPSQLDMVARSFVQALLSGLPDRTVHDFNALADRIFPMLKPIAMLATVRERNLPMLVYREFLADLIITYVVDEARSVTFLNEEHLNTWDVSAQDVHERALHNLQRRTAEGASYITTGSGSQQLFIFNTNDGYDATRLLLTDVLAEWAEQTRGNLVIGIPNRDFLIAFSDADPEIVQAVAQQVQADAAQREYGLTDQLFTFVNGQVREYRWD
jgi:uncharacterized protein YtpQ (UPF0354 family)